MDNDFYIIKPSINNKEDIIDYLNEMKKYNSNINGIGKLDEYVNDNKDCFIEWLDYLKDSEKDGFPLREQYLFIRKSDNRIIGMINIRTNSNLKDYLYGHIGYSIRPLERNKGYGKILLKLAINRLKELDIKECIIAIKDNYTISKKLINSFNPIFYKSIVIDGIKEDYYKIDVDMVINN